MLVSVADFLNRLRGSQEFAGDAWAVLVCAVIFPYAIVAAYVTGGGYREVNPTEFEVSLRPVAWMLTDFRVLTQL
jgi:hypothetical protein